MVEAPAGQPLSKRARQRIARRRRNRVAGALGVTGAIVGAAILLALLPPGLNTALHQHPHIQIFLAGREQMIASDIGIAAVNWSNHSLDAYAEMGGMSPIHTHDSSGVIHLELGRWRPCTLGDFFSVWGQPFDDGHLLSYVGTVTMTVNDKPSTAFAGLILQDGQRIVLRGG